MTTFPGSPRMIKGAIIGIDAANPLASIVIFQYNPDTMTRRLEAQTVQGQDGTGRSEPLRLKGPPAETISLEVEIDATDQMEQGDPLVAALGISPQLAALEMLIYPKTSIVLANSALLAAGTIEVIPPEAPFTLFVWGPTRVVPVRVQDFSIKEEAYDPALNPIRATVSLSLRVLSYSDLPMGHPGYGVFLAHQVAKEVMATIGSLGNAAGAVSGSIGGSIG